MENLLQAAQEVREKAFRVVFTTARYWGHNHIVNAAPTIVPLQLTQLVNALEHTLLQHHFTFEQRSYKPHVTLLRHAHWTDTPLPLMSPVVWAVRDFVLVQSHGEGQDLRYEVMAHFPLGE